MRRGLKAIAGKPGYEIDCGWTAKGVADALLTAEEQEDIMNEHVHEWALDSLSRIPFCTCKFDGCKEILSKTQAEAMLNTTEMLSAEAAQDIISWEGGASGHIANMKNWYALKASANIPEEPE